MQADLVAQARVQTVTKMHVVVRRAIETERPGRRYLPSVTHRRSDGRYYELARLDRSAAQRRSGDRVVLDTATEHAGKDRVEAQRFPAILLQQRIVAGLRLEPLRKVLPAV